MYYFLQIIPLNIFYKHLQLDTNIEYITKYEITRTIKKVYYNTNETYIYNTS